jgi:hypothetical protein
MYRTDGNNDNLPTRAYAIATVMGTMKHEMFVVSAAWMILVTFFAYLFADGTSSYSAVLLVIGRSVTGSERYWLQLFGTID